MDFHKNTIPFHNICRVQVREISGRVEIPELTTIYHTPSNISLSNRSSDVAAGNQYTRSLSLTFPGLSSEDFNKFDDFLRGDYQVYIKLDTGEIYEIATPHFPMIPQATYIPAGGHTITFSLTTPLPIKFRGIQEGPDIDDDGFDYDFDFYLS